MEQLFVVASHIVFCCKLKEKEPYAVISMRQLRVEYPLGGGEVAQAAAEVVDNGSRVVCLSIRIGPRREWRCSIEKWWAIWAKCRQRGLWGRD